MEVTTDQIKRTIKDWSAIAGEKVAVVHVGDMLYGYTSELGALRLYLKYANPNKCKVVENNVDDSATHIFSLRMGF
jgi:hypothetical protein